MYKTIRDIHNCLSDLLNAEIEVEVRGWLLSTRKQAENTFLMIQDGSYSDPLQILIETSKVDKLSTGMSLRVIGKLVKSPAKGQLFEVLAHSLEIEGEMYSNYPISKTGLSLEYLRNHAHLRPRTRTFQSIFRIRHGVMMATHRFFDQEGFYLIDPNIITTSECEGGAGVFQLVERDIMNKKQPYSHNLDHFGKPVYLTVSSQLQLEAFALSMGKVYTTNKSFRSEHSNTHKHVSEFTHLEIEQCFTNLEDLMNIAENFVKYVTKQIYNSYSKDLELLENSAKFNEGIDKEIKKRYEIILISKFARITYKDAIELMQKQPKNLLKVPNYGEDVSSEHEKYLTEYFGCPVFLTHWPIEIKSFYMKQCLDGTCESFDLLMPHVGELIGASQREENYDKLVSIMKQKGIALEPLSFYLDLRKYGSVQHGGFGLGLDRFIMFLTGIHNIKDVIPIPIYYQNCIY